MGHNDYLPGCPPLIREAPHLPRSPQRAHLILLTALTVLGASVASAGLLSSPTGREMASAAIGALARVPAPDAEGGSGRNLRASPLDALPDPIDDEHGPFEPTVAADPGDDQHLVAAAMSWEKDEWGVNRVWAHTHVSRDGGASWSTARFPGGVTAGPTHPLFLYDHISDPVLTILPDGTVLFAAFANQWHFVKPEGIALAYHSGGGSLFVARSFDGGETWPDIEVLRLGLTANAQVQLLDDPALNAPAGVFLSFNDKPWTAVGPEGEVLLVWADLQFPPLDNPVHLYNVDMWFALSRDSGETWTAPQRIVDGMAYPALPAILSDGGLRVAFRDALTDGKWEMIASDDDGATWERHTILPASEIGPMLNTSLLGPTLVLQRFPTHDRLVLPFNTDGPGPHTQVLKFIASDDGGDTWSSPVALDEPTTSIRETDGYFPPLLLPSSAAADAEGNVYVTYFHIPVGGEDAADFKVVRITDSGASAPLVLDPQLPGSPYKRGHYMGMAGLSLGAYPVWVSGACATPGTLPCSLVGAHVGPE